MYCGNHEWLVLLCVIAVLWMGWKGTNIHLSYECINEHLCIHGPRTLPLLLLALVREWQYIKIDKS